ncbi:Membrane protein involved in the export of O-antigen and teichoic acid [Bacteroides luti]|uniref:Membrane protein involved in the export of O-antigen and teichoic acid n=1 Tax=Bacteroides luti TaxID=1297750 RepID=A0A1M4WJJ4_9BACE|nr:hypothetical protein [Bacteroides luti]SHE81243.1 Membrane protein involved in the export of O-antigen and teichoic acid [Bacteroides luti]
MFIQDDLQKNVFIILKIKILSLIKNLAYKIGVDKAVAYTSIARIIQAGGSIISILFVVRYLTGVEQGFYYTFGSILAIQVFFELGLNGIITQYVAHEASHLTLRDGMYLEGEEKYKSRLSSLLHFSVKWYSVFAIVLFVALMVVGFVFFTKYDKSGGLVSWRFPWTLLCICTAVNLLIAPVFAYLEGLGKVKEVAKIRLYQNCFGLFFVWSSLFLGAKLMVSGINSLVWILSASFFIFATPFKVILFDIWHISIIQKVSYKHEIFPYQWKIALSWISGYFIFQLFNPVLFATDGAVVAGQMGMTLAVLNGISSLSMSWISTKIPMFSGLIELKNYNQLDMIFNKTLKQLVFINALGLIVMLFVFFVIKTFHITLGGMNLGDRFLNYIPMILMVIPSFLNQFVGSWATYLRCHKQEPFLVNSLVSGILCCFSTVLMGKFLGVIGITGGYCLISACSLPWAYNIYITKKNEWHNEK